MPNGLDVKVNGSATPRKVGEAPPLVPTNGSGVGAGATGGTGDELEGFALANLPFVEDLYFQYLEDPATVDPTWRRTFQGLNGSAGDANGNGAGASALVPPVAFKRSIFGG